MFELAEELRSQREAGQPLIDERLHPRTDIINVHVYWDAWEGIGEEDRLETILAAYREAEGEDYADRIALAVGLTIPEAGELGLLPFSVIPLLRPRDPVTADQCSQAMIEEGASTLRKQAIPELRFSTLEDAERCRQRLIERLPESEPIWSVQAPAEAFQPCA